MSDINPKGEVLKEYNSAGLSAPYPAEIVDKKLEEAKIEAFQKIAKIDDKIKDVNYVVITGFIVLLVMVATLVIDSFHFNSAVYREYSQKTESIEDIQQANKILLKQIKDLSEQNIQDREIIMQILNNNKSSF